METLQLSSKNVAGCNGLRVNGDSISGIIRFDLDGFDSGAGEDHVTLQFPNLQGVDKAILRLQDLRKLWNETSEREGK